jgi:hypothetical protein
MRKSVIGILGVCELLLWLLGECSSSFISPTEGKYRSQDIPGNVTASDTLTSGLVRITWDSVANAEGYLVYRSKGPAIDSFLLVSGEVSGQVYLDSTVVPETTYFYRVRTILRSGDTSLPSSSDMGKALVNPSAYIPAFAASDGSFADRVVLTWRKPFPGIRVIASGADSTGTSWIPICTTTVDTTRFDSLVTPGPHLYRLAVVHDSTGNTEYFFDNGYRSVTDREFFIEVNKTVNHSENKLTKLGSIGSEQKQGDTTGTITYNAKMNGLSSVNISIDYVDYRDYYLTLSGRQYTVITNLIAQSGTVTDTVRVAGIYPGALVYDVSVDGGKPVGGTYTVIQQGQSPDVIQFADVAQYVQ